MASIMIYELLTRQTYLTTWKTDKAENENVLGKICVERTHSSTTQLGPVVSIVIVLV